MILRRDRPDEPADPRPIGGSIFAGVPLTLRLPDLRGAALLVVCYTAISTVLYVEIADAVGRAMPSAAARTRFFAGVDLAVNGLALLTQALVTKRLVQRRGLRVALSVVPVLVLAGLGVLGAWHTLTALVAVQVIHRAGEFSLVRPGREMIYTTVGPEARYKAKNFIDTTVYRANDAVSAWLIAAVRTAGWPAALLVAVPAACGWLVTGYWVGRRHDRHEPA
jgi:AAA family ATP:ADP antiporter